MSTYNFHGDVNGPGNYGDHGRIEIHGDTGSEIARTLAAGLLENLHAATADPRLIEQAELVHAELVRADDEHEQPDRHRLRQWLAAITAIAGAGGDVAVSVEHISHALGIG